MLQQVCSSPSSPLSYLPPHLYLHVPAHRFCSLSPILLEKKKKSDIKALKMMGGGGGGGAVGAASLSMASSSAGTPIPSRPVRTDTDSAYVQTQTVCTNRYLLSSVCLTIFHSLSRLFFHRLSYSRLVIDHILLAVRSYSLSLPSSNLPPSIPKFILYFLTVYLCICQHCSLPAVIALILHQHHTPHTTSCHILLFPSLLSLPLSALRTLL
jgi:hypothetical protein